MLHDIKKINGFTLVELLVSIGIIGIISVISTQTLWNSITTRSKQDSIEVSSENFRTFTKNLTNYIQESNSVDISSDSKIIKLVKKGTDTEVDVCRTIRYNSTKKSIEEAAVIGVGCIPTEDSSLFHIVTEDEGRLEVDTFTLSPTGLQPNTVTVTIIGQYLDLLGEPPHPISFVTTITPRIAL